METDGPATEQKDSLDMYLDLLRLLVCMAIIHAMLVSMNDGDDGGTS